jgi:hypothetical protein
MSHTNERVRTANALPESVTAAYERAIIDNGSKEDAMRAMEQARSYSERFLSGLAPSVDISEDGVVTFQWRRPDRGVLLVFTGDNTVSCAVKVPGGHYSTSNISAPIDEPMPSTVMSAIEMTR